MHQKSDMKSFDLGMGGRVVVRSLLQLSERWICHIKSVGTMEFASLETNLGGVEAF